MRHPLVLFDLLFLKNKNPSNPDEDILVDSNGHVTTMSIIKKREDEAKEFWHIVSKAEELFGRKMTEKEVWKAMQNNRWRCVCCGDVLEKIDEETVKCPTCYLRFKYLKGHIKTVSMNGKLI